MSNEQRQQKTPFFPILSFKHFLEWECISLYSSHFTLIYEFIISKWHLNEIIHTKSCFYRPFINKISFELSEKHWMNRFICTDFLFISSYKIYILLRWKIPILPTEYPLPILNDSKFNLQIIHLQRFSRYFTNSNARVLHTIVNVITTNHPTNIYTHFVSLILIQFNVNHFN